MVQAAGRLIRGAVEAAKQLKRETRLATFPGGEVIVERRPHGVVYEARLFMIRALD